MTTNFTPNSGRFRRTLLTSVAVFGIGAGALFSAPAVFSQASNSPNQVTAQNALRPIGFADIVERVKPAVIGVRVKGENTAGSVGEETERPGEGTPFDRFERFFRRFGPQEDQPEFRRGPQGPQGPQGRQGPQAPRRFGASQGSGFFITADGYAVTNNHVIRRGSDVQIQTDEGKTYPAKVVGTDEKTDLALLKVDGRNDFPFVKLSEGAPRIGDWVLAVGNPFGLGGTVTAGIVSARGRDIGAGPYDDFLQIDAPINRGNSGGPTFDVDGNVIGVNTAIYSPSGGNVGIAFAIPSETVRSVVNQLRDKGIVTRGWIGVQIQPVTQEIADSIGLKQARGALVAEPQAEGPAVKAGILSGDVIVSVNNEPIKAARDLARTISAIPPGTQVRLGVVSQGKERTVTLTLGELPATTQEARVNPTEREPQGREVPRLGLSLAPAGSVGGAGAEGVVVTNVDPNGVAAERGFKNGDVILDIGGKAVTNVADVRKALTDAGTDGKTAVLVRVKSGQSTRFVAVPVSRG